jgi:hypothetical protein
MLQLPLTLQSALDSDQGLFSQKVVITLAHIYQTIVIVAV